MQLLGSVLEAQQDLTNVLINVAWHLRGIVQVMCGCDEGVDVCLHACAHVGVMSVWTYVYVCMQPSSFPSLYSSTFPASVIYYVFGSLL